jgi:hypothetical protein
LKFEINGEQWTTWEGVHEFYGNKFTREQLDQAVKDGLVRTLELPVEGTPYTFTAYNEYDVAINQNKFKKLKVEEWF